MPSASTDFRTRSAMPSAATPGSVTSRARLTPSRLSSHPASATAPAPNLIGVASSVNTVSRTWIPLPATMAADTLARRLRDIVGAGHVLEEPGLRAPYEVDWTGRFRQPARLVVRPADAAQTAAVVTACGQAGAALVPQGGNTGLVGGGVPRGGEVVLSLRRLDTVGHVDPATAQVDTGAGAPLDALQSAAARAGLDAGIDFAARDSATVGGLTAADAGGRRALRHG